MRFVLVVLCLLIAVNSAQAQSSKAVKAYEKAKQHYDDDEYDDAISNFKKAIKSYKEYEDAYYYLGASYYYDDQLVEAIETFQKLEDMNPDYWAYFYYWWAVISGKDFA